MTDISYIVLCKASGEHFTFNDTKELVDFLNPTEGEPHFANFHEDLRIFRVSGELTPAPKDKVNFPMVRSWLLREKR